MLSIALSRVAYLADIVKSQSNTEIVRRKYHVLTCKDIQRE